MATVFSHPAVALGLIPWFRDVRSSKLVVLTGVVLSILPDIDVLAFRIGIPYAHTFGHRGFTHSLFFAALVSAVCAWIISRYLTKRMFSIWVFLFVCMASHGFIDAFTNGGYGIALLSPFSNERYFFPVQPLEVSTLSIRRFFQGQGIGVLISELQWVWLPCLALFILGLFRLKIPAKSIIKESQS
jgi:inner membrane protein